MYQVSFRFKFRWKFIDNPITKHLHFKQSKNSNKPKPEITNVTNKRGISEMIVLDADGTFKRFKEVNE